MSYWRPENDTQLSPEEIDDLQATYWERNDRCGDPPYEQGEGVPEPEPQIGQCQRCSSVHRPVRCVMCWEGVLLTVCAPCEVIVTASPGEREFIETVRVECKRRTWPARGPSDRDHRRHRHHSSLLRGEEIAASARDTAVSSHSYLSLRPTAEVPRGNAHDRERVVPAARPDPETPLGTARSLPIQR